MAWLRKPGLVAERPPRRKACGKPKLIYKHAILEVDEMMSTNTALKTGSVKHGMAYQSWRDLQLVDNRRSLVNNTMYVAMKSAICCTEKAYQWENFKVRTPQLTRPQSASKQASKTGGAPLTDSVT